MLGYILSGLNRYYKIIFTSDFGKGLKNLRWNCLGVIPVGHHGSGRGKLALFLSKLVTCKYIKSFSAASVLFNEEVIRVKKYPANHKTTGNRDQNKDFFL